MTNDFSEEPLALLLGLDGSERVWTLTSLPPPRELLIPVKQRMAVNVEDVAYQPPPHRVFRLRADLVSKSHHWWYYTNDRRTRHPEDGFVYLETR